MANDRYHNLYKALSEFAAAPPRTDRFRFLEVGAHDGTRAAALIAHWQKMTNRPISYFGFDLFEDMTPGLGVKEVVKSRPAPSIADVRKRLSKTGAKIHLTKGNTREVLPKAVAEMLDRGLGIDLIFIDGGHSLDTVESDWGAIKPLVEKGAVVLFDDYFENRTDIGCKPLVDRLRADPAWDVGLLDPLDKPENTGFHTRMVGLRLAGWKPTGPTDAHRHTDGQAQGGDGLRHRDGAVTPVSGPGVPEGANVDRPQPVLAPPGVDVPADGAPGADAGLQTRPHDGPETLEDEVGDQEETPGR